MRGMSIRVTATELVTHCTKRSKYHTERAEWYFSEAKRHEEEQKKWEAMDLGRDEMAKSSYNNSRQMGESCRSNGKDHTRNANKFAFLAEHVVAEDYDLSMSECYELEFISNR